MMRKGRYRGWFGVGPTLLLIAILPAKPRDEFIGRAPPCGNMTVSLYPGVDGSPAVRAWGRERGRDWAPPAYTGWTAPGFTTLVITVALFRHGSGGEGLPRRIGAISELRGMRYWSTAHKRWQTLMVDDYALCGASGSRCRSDFAPGEVATGSYLCFRQEDNLSGNAIYRMHIQSASPDRLVFDSENVSAVRYLMWPLFRPGELQSIYFLERESTDVWGYYSISRTGRNASRITGGRDASAINRAVAFFCFLADIPTDQEPPASL